MFEDTRGTKRDWLERFGVRLLKLQPSMHALMAAEHAVATYADASDMDPEEAGDIFVVVSPPGECGPEGH